MKHAEITAEPGKPELFVNHVFNAPLAKVYKVYTDPEMIPKWWGPERLTTKIEKLEFTPAASGGSCRKIETAKSALSTAIITRLCRTSG